jgi:hypothetical protein
LLWLFFYLAAITACTYALFGAMLLRQFAQKSPVTLKPLCGAESELEANLVSFCNQDNRPRQLISGGQDLSSILPSVLVGLKARSCPTAAQQPAMPHGGGMSDMDY